MNNKNEFKLLHAAEFSIICLFFVIYNVYNMLQYACTTHYEKKPECKKKNPTS